MGCEPILEVGGSARSASRFAKDVMPAQADTPTVSD